MTATHDPPFSRRLPRWWPAGTAAAIVLVSLLLRLFRLDAPPIPVFDEGLFYIPAARAYLLGQPDPNFEHPPLGKLAFAAGMLLLGDNLWGYRLMSVVAGTAGVGLAYLLGRRLWGSPLAGVLAAVLLAADTLWLLFSRLMMYDVLLGCLVLAAMSAAWRHRETGALRWLALAGACTGLAAAVKWSGVWALAPLALAAAFAPGVLQWAAAGQRFVVVALCVGAGYLLPWVHHVLALGYTPASLVQRHLDMLAYGTSIGAPLDPAERWLTPLRWLLDLPLVFTAREDRSVWLVAVANPLLLWGGLAVLAAGFVAALRGRRVAAWLASPPAFLLAWVLAFYLPWFGFLRVKYLYYLVPLMPALTLALAGPLAAAFTGPRKLLRLAATGYLAATVAVLLGLYPALSGIWSRTP